MAVSRQEGHVLIVTPTIKDDIRSLVPSSSRGPGRVDKHKFCCTVNMPSAQDAQIVLTRVTHEGLSQFPGSRFLVHYLQTFSDRSPEVTSCNGGDDICRHAHVFGTEPGFLAYRQRLYERGFASLYSTVTPTQLPTLSREPSASASSSVSTQTTYSSTDTNYADAVQSAYGVQFGAEYAALVAYGQQAMHSMPTAVPTEAPVVAPTYQLSPSTGLLVNTAAGAVVTESKGIVIRGLSYKTTEEELKKFLKQYAKPRKVHLKCDEDGRSKGSAIVTYASANEAAIAQARLDGRELRRHKLSVKLDREGRTAGDASCGPVIVNGSTAA